MFSYRIRRFRCAVLPPAPRLGGQANWRTKKAQHFASQSAGFWRRPTLARPVAVLPLGLQRFTSVFGMGTGGTTALLSPEKKADGLELIVESNQLSISAHLWRFTFGFQRTLNNQLIALIL